MQNSVRKLSTFDFQRQFSFEFGSVSCDLVLGALKINLGPVALHNQVDGLWLCFGHCGFVLAGQLGFSFARSETCAADQGSADQVADQGSVLYNFAPSFKREMLDFVLAGLSGLAFRRRKFLRRFRRLWVCVCWRRGRFPLAFRYLSKDLCFVMGSKSVQPRNPFRFASKSVQVRLDSC